VGDRLARLLGKDASFGHHRQVEAFPYPRVDLDAIGEVLQRGNRLAEARLQALGLRRDRGEPARLQSGDQGAVGKHRAEHGYALLVRQDPQFGEPARSRQPGRYGLLLGNAHLQNRLRRRSRPAVQPTQ
jgi:hypothetical protein